MAIISAAIAAAGSALAGAASFIGGLGVFGQLALGLGLQLATKALFKPEKPGPTGTRLEVQYGADRPREIGLGLFASAGHDIYTNTYGDSNKFIQKVFVLSDWRIDGLSRVAVNGEWRVIDYSNFNADSGYLIEDFDNHLRIKIYDGTQTAADARLIGTSNPPGRWTADHIGRGCAYAIITAEFDDESLSSFPQFLFECRGAPLYDLRRDSTMGGSGSHRWDNPATWEYANGIGTNPIIQAYNYERGFFTAGEKIIGKGMPASDLPPALWMSAANVCDEPVDGAGRYRSGCIVTAEAGVTHRDNLEPILQAAAADLVERVDGDAPLVGANQPVVATLTDDDLIVGQPATFRAKRSRSELINAVFGSYNEPADLWSATAYPPRLDAAGLAADRERHAAQINFGAVYDLGQGIRLADIAVRENRYQASASIVVRPRWIVLEAGDWIRWNSARRGDRTYRVVSRSLAPLGENGARNVTLQLEEVGNGIYDSAVTVPETVPRVPLAGPVFTLTVPNFQVLAAVAESPSGRAYPAILAQWDAIDDVTVDAVLVEYWKTSDPTNRLQARVQMPAQRSLIVEGVLPLTSYTLQAAVVTSPPRPTIWSVQRIVTTQAEDLAFEAGQLQDDIASYLADIRRAQGDFDALIEGLATSTATSATHLQLASARLNNEAFRLDSEVRTVGARLISEEFLREAGDEAVAAAVTRAEARLDGLATTQTGQAVALETLTARVSETETGIEAVAESVEGVRTEVDDPATGLAAQGQAINVLQSQSGAGRSTVQSLAELAATLDVVAANAAAAGAGSVERLRIASTRSFEIETASVSRDLALAERTSGVEARLTVAETGLAGNAAAIGSLSATVSSQDSRITANAAAITGVQASVGNVTASGLISFQVISQSGSGASAVSRIAILGRAQVGDSFKQSGLYIDTTATASTILVLTDRFLVTDGVTGTPPFVVQGGVVKLGLGRFQQLVSDNGRLVIDGSGNGLITMSDAT